MARRQRQIERQARAASLRRRRLLAGAALALLIGVGLMIAVDPTVGVAAGMVIGLGAVWLARRG